MPRDLRKFCLFAPEPSQGGALSAALETGLVEAVFLPAASIGDGAGLIDLPARHQAALLVVDDVDLAGQIGAGVVITQGSVDLGPIRTRLGDDAIVGIVGGLTRHDGLEAAQAGADFVGLGAFNTPLEPQELEDLTELLSWWNEMIEIPCVAFGADTPEAATRLLAAGADTVALSADLWATDAPAATLRAIAGQ